MINFYNYRLAPWMLCKLLYDVVPEKFHRRVVFSYGNQYMPRRCKHYAGLAYEDEIRLNLEAIAFHPSADVAISASRSAAIWHQLLKVGFHEFGHIALGHCRIPRRRKKDCQFRQYIEDQAHAKAEEWMGKILACNGRMYQPDFLGKTDIVWHEYQNRMNIKIPGEINWVRIKDARCHITGGQLSAGDVVCNLFSRIQMEELDMLLNEDSISHEDYQGWLRSQIRLVHKHGDDLARVHIDSAGRQHRFWVWGDVPIIARRLASHPELQEEFYGRKLMPEGCMLEKGDK